MAVKSSLINFFKKESATGILLILGTFAAMLCANSFLYDLYNSFLQVPVMVRIGAMEIAKPMLLWINDGLMAIFFFMVGLEIKRELLEGSLRESSQIVVPLLAAIGGMAVPSLIFVAFNYGDPGAMQGWAIPSATDIAFALGILSLLGPRVPLSLKVFLLALAIIDDLGAIIIIALFYTSDLSLESLYVALAAIMLLYVMNRNHVLNNTAYILVGIILWTAVLKSGVHATLAGVILGLMIPLRENKESFHALERSMHAPVNFVILPLFAFANTGIRFDDISMTDFTANLTLGITVGLFVGKQLGIFMFSYAAVRLGLGRLPEGVTWPMLYGVAILSGIGFTMSLFIGSLAFECSGEFCFSVVDERMGILMGSLLSGIVGYAMLRSQIPSK